MLFILQFKIQRIMYSGSLLDQNSPMTTKLTIFCFAVYIRTRIVLQFHLQLALLNIPVCYFPAFVFLLSKLLCRMDLSSVAIY